MFSKQWEIYHQRTQQVFETLPPAVAQFCRWERYAGEDREHITDFVFENRGLRFGIDLDHFDGCPFALAARVTSLWVKAVIGLLSLLFPIESGSTRSSVSTDKSGQVLVAFVFRR